uniref:probable serine/threonine-protein kinase At1g01540 n=1 Tax=Erigeron canadensis TaxID=72917 RepID=UPI001CB94CED|nr:probable serine/threonine-protein kinase At1g01540 [Erigeron canadensis]
MNDQQTLVFGLHLWIILGITVGAIFVLILFLISIWFTSYKNINNNNRSSKPSLNPQPNTPINSLPSSSPQQQEENTLMSTQQRLSTGIEKQALLFKQKREKMNRVLMPVFGEGGDNDDQSVINVGPEVSHLGWGHWYTLRELEVATDGFSADNVIGQGGYGIVYYGVLVDNSTSHHVAVKNLLNNRDQAEKEFQVEVEAIGRVRHKNLVRLLGYCAEGAHRILVYEYMNNGNLEQWVHGDVGPCSPLTWEIRMKIIVGIAKALTYLHEGLEPKVVHRDIKSSNILLDKFWNPKVSDFGLAKLLGADMSYITTRVMGTLGYVAPEYASTGMVNEKSDVYSFGILLMELISGRYPVDHKRPQEEVHLVEWVKRMLRERCPEKVLDPKLIDVPSSHILKRILVVALRCADLNSEKRPRIGHVIHMLESQDQSRNSERKPMTDSRVAPHGSPNDGLNTKQATHLGV